MNSRWVGAALAIMLISASGASAHGYGHNSDPMFPAPREATVANEAPADVDLEIEKLAAEREAAVARNAPAGELARLDARRVELEKRRRIAQLRLDRDRARRLGKSEEAARLDREIHAAKQTLGRPAPRRRR